jgi:hypothetical protein
MKKIVLDIFSYFGYEIQRKGASNNPFKVQKELNSSEEPIIFNVGAQVGQLLFFIGGYFLKPIFIHLNHILPRLNLCVKPPQKMREFSLTI